MNLNRNYWKIAWRQIVKHKGYASVHIIGLSLGIAACMLILLYVWDEWNYDRFHEDHDKIFRVTTLETEEGVSLHKANAYLPIAEKLRTQMPEIEVTTRYLPFNTAIEYKNGNKLFQEDKFIFVDSSYNDMFELSFVQGDQFTALHAPNAVVLTEETSRKYFGEANPMGKVLTANNLHQLVVTGVVKSMPGNSTIQFDLLANIKSASVIIGSWINDNDNTWYYPPTFTYIKFENEVHQDYLKQRMQNFVQNHLPVYLEDRYEFSFQPLKNMHFEELEQDMNTSISAKLLLVLLGIAIIIFVMACINYINLSLAKLMDRFKSLSVRKVLGARDKEIFRLLGIESMIVFLAALIISSGLVHLSLPAFNTLVGKNFHLLNINLLPIWGVLSFFILLISLMISLVPFLALKNYNLIHVIQKKWKRPAKNEPRLNLRRGLIIAQFSAATILITCTIIIQSQLDYIQHADIGVNKEEVLVVPIRNEDIQENFSSVKNELLAVNGVKSVSAISNFPWESGFYNWQTSLKGEGKEVNANLSTLIVDEDFVQTMDLRLKSGRTFSSDIAQDKSSNFLVNEQVYHSYNFDKDQGN